MAIKEAWIATADLFLCPLLFVIAVIDFLPNPARYLIRRLVSSEPSQPQTRPAPHKTGRRILMAVDETSKEAFDWALTSFLDCPNDHIYLLYIPEGDYRKSTYSHRKLMNRRNYTDVLPGVDFLWEYCQRLDLANVEFDCIVEPMVLAKDVSKSILSKASALRPEMVLMGASKRAGPEDVGATAYQVSVHSPVPVIVIK